MNLEIAQRLQQLRQTHGYSQETLAEKLGLSRQAVSKWERAESSPDTDNLIELAKLYGVSLDELLFGKTTAEKTEADAPVMPQPVAEEPTEETAEPAVEQLEGVVIDTPHSRRIHWNAFPYPVFATLVFLIWGFLGGWYISWTMFLTVPLYYSLVSTIRTRNPSHFAWPVFVTFVFCFTGMQWGIWHPMWMIFLTVPLYYSICSMFR
ncbi:MAG: helix-turn-helix transcriptional regulator [Clostridia bacterium]|nr:helix-turn-helix transcriptional regulator [Clostridia bacterium]